MAAYASRGSIERVAESTACGNLLLGDRDHGGLECFDFGGIGHMSVQLRRQQPAQNLAGRRDPRSVVRRVLADVGAGIERGNAVVQELRL
jgi:hypothetical protein